MVFLPGKHLLEC